MSKTPYLCTYVSDQIVHAFRRSTDANVELNGCQFTAVTATLRTKNPPDLGVRNGSTEQLLYLKIKNKVERMHFG